jgi:ATP-dependent DNA ligase
MTPRSAEELEYKESSLKIATALTSLPHGTVIDGELVAIDNDGRPDFNLLQNYRSSEAHLVYFAFDILAHKGKSLLELALESA